MSVPGLALAPVPATAPTAAPTRRPEPVRPESQPTTFAEMLDDTRPTETASPSGTAKPAKSTDASETEPAGETEVEAGVQTMGDTDPASALEPPLPVLSAVLLNVAPSLVLASGNDTPDAVPDPDPALDATAPAHRPLPAPPVTTVPAPVIAAKPVVDKPTETTETAPQGEDDAPNAASQTPTAPTRVRDVIEHAGSRSSGNAQTASTAQTASATPQAIGPATDSAKVPTTATPDLLANQGAAPRASAEISSPAVTVLDVVEPTQPVQTGPTPDARANESAATGPVLSTLSQTVLQATAQIAAQIVKKLEGQSTRFEMALTPDDLGRVDVSLNIDADGQLSARLAFDNPLAAADLRGRVDELRRQLTDAGFTVADDALSFDQRDPQAGNGGAFDRGNDRHSARAFGAASRLSQDADAALIPPRWMSLTLTPERVDMKV